MALTMIALGILVSKLYILTREKNKKWVKAYV